MSLNSLSLSNHVPFFPPGIASHKTSSSFKRPQNVKECKKLSKNRCPKPLITIKSSKRLSTSSPNIMACISSSDQVLSIPKHNCDMGLSDHNTFRATPLPQYYSPDSLERNRTLFEQLDHNYKTRSLDRTSAIAKSLDQVTKSKTLTNFVPDKPFYPPSKYPNIHDKSNLNLQRFLETRQQYKTPESRKSVMMKNRNKDRNSRPTNLSMKISDIGGSVPNLALRHLKDIPNNPSKDEFNKRNLNKKSPDRSLSKCVIDQVEYSPEMGFYRSSHRLDLQDEFDFCVPKQMSTSYFYPKPIPNQFYNDYNSKMAQSLYNESSLAAKIHTGSLERAARNNYYSNNNDDKIEVTDLDDSPSKSYSPIKQCNSFSQDSLDGTRRNAKALNDANSEKAGTERTDSLTECEKSYNSISEEISNGTESKTYKFQSPTEEDYSQENVENPNRYINSLSTISERDKTSEDHKRSSVIDKYGVDKYCESNTNLNENNSKTYKNTTDNLEDSSIISDSKSSKILNPLENDIPNVMSENNHFFQERNRLENNQIYNRVYDSNGIYSENANHNINKSSDNFIHHSNESLFHIKSEKNIPTNNSEIYNSSRNSPINNENKNKKSSFLLDQYNLDRYLKDDSIPTETGFQNFIITRDSIPINSEFLNENSVTNISRNDRVLLDQIASKCIVSTNESFNFKKENCVCIDNAIIGESFKYSINVQDHPKPNEIDSATSTIYSTINTQVSGLDYDLSDIGVTNQLFNEMKNRQLPRIKIHSDVTNPIEDSSETESSLSGSDDTSYLGYDCNSVHLPRRGKSWVSSPELTIARSDIVSRRRSRHLQSENPLKPLCNVCFKPAYFMERISINNIIFHKMCFLCRKCDTHLSFNNCIIHRRKPYCVVHAKPKTLKPTRSASTNKLNQIKERLDSKTNKQTNNEVKHQKRVFYGGIKSAKEKFLQEQNSVQEPVVRQQKRFTPPRQGVNAGVIESEPKPRDPNIITSDDGTNSYNDDLTLLAQSSATKEKLARFKELQERSFDKTQTNEDDSTLTMKEMISVDTKSLRNKFLSSMNGNDSEPKMKKLNPSEEIQELARRESNSIYENKPEVRMDVVKSDQSIEEPTVTVSKNKAKELKDKFSNYVPDEKTKKPEKFQMEIGEGGIYESQPQERSDDIIPHKADKDFILPNNTVKSGLQKIKELQTIKSQGYQKSNNEPIKLDLDITNGGIYENKPAESLADSVSDQNEEYLNEIPDKKYANEAKRLFLERQQQQEESRNKRNTPQMIDIWKDLCIDSGVFENKPKLQNKDVMRHDDKINEELTVEDQGAGEEVASEVNSDENR